MKKISKALTVLAGLCMGLSVSCGGASNAFFVTGNASLSDECVVTPGTRLLSGALDVSLRNDYIAHLITTYNRGGIVVQQPSQSPSYTDFGPAQEHLSIERVELTYQLDSAQQLGPAMQAVTTSSGYSLSAGGALAKTDQLTTTSTVNLIAGDALQALRQEPLVNNAGTVPLVVSATLVGKTSDGRELRSNTFNYQINVCDGCVEPTCPAGERLAFNGCNPGQDNGMLFECTAE